MADGFIGLPADEGGKKLRTGTRMVGGVEVHEEYTRDDYESGEVLAEQAGAGAVLMFSFAVPVSLVVVESSGDGLVARADPFGGTPSALLGIPCRHETPVYIPVTTATVRVFAPAGAAVNVYGMGRL